MAQITHISVGKDGAVWCADDLQRLWERPRPGMGTSLGPWLRYPSAIAHLVTVGSADQVWCVNNQGDAFQLHRPDTWQKDAHASHIKTLSAAADGTVWCGNTDGELFQRDKDTWKKIEGRATLVAVGSKDHVWCVNTDGEAFQLDSHGAWQKDGGVIGARTISVGADGAVWYGNTEGRLFHREGATWQKDADGRASVVAVGSKDQVWCVNNDGDAFWRNTQGHWEKAERPTGWEYKTKAGDHLYAIVRAQFHLTEAELPGLVGRIAAENNIQNVDHLPVGSTLTY